MIKSSLTPNRPFVIEHLRLNETPKGFVPAARVQITEAARTSGLLRELSGAQARTLLALLTYLTPNGHLYATADHVARALGIPTSVAALWLWRFSHRRFQGQPVIHRMGRQSASDAYTIAHTLIQHVSRPSALDRRSQRGSAETIIKNAREHY